MHSAKTCIFALDLRVREPCYIFKIQNFCIKKCKIVFLILCIRVPKRSIVLRRYGILHKIAFSHFAYVSLNGAYFYCPSTSCYSKVGSVLIHVGKVWKTTSTPGPPFWSIFLFFCKTLNIAGDQWKMTIFWRYKYSRNATFIVRKSCFS